MTFLIYVQYEAGLEGNSKCKKTVKEWFKDWVKGGSRTVFGGFYPIFEPLSIEHLPYEQRGMAQI